MSQIVIKQEKGNVRVPEGIFDQHIILLGKTRSGKSSVMRLLVEHLLDQEKPVGVIDPKGDWWGLKSSASGKEAGYPLVIFGGEHADVPINARSGTPVAELVAAENRPYIVDLGGWMVSERTQFWIDFASTFFRLSRGRRWLAIDEVHNLCPKGKIMDPNAGKMLHWSNRLASEGLGKGIGLLAASQRPQKVHNDFLTSCETLIAMRVIHAADRRAIKEWIDGCGDPDRGPQVVDTLAEMKRGEGWAWSPEAEFGPVRIQFPLFKTYDSFRPQNAQLPAKLKGWAEVDLAAVTKKLEAAVNEARANDPNLLRCKIGELERELRAKSGQVPKSKELADEKAIQRAVMAAIKPRDGALADMKKALTGISAIAARAAGIGLPEAPMITVSHDAAPAASLRRRNGPSPAPHAGDISLKAGARRMLAIIAQWHPEAKTRDELGALAGFAPTGGTFAEYLSGLRRSGLICETGDGISITDDGLAQVGAVPPRPASTAELVSMWKSKFKAGIGRMLDVLVEAHPHMMTREELGERSGFAASGGTFAEYLSSLRRARLIEESGTSVKAANSLFP